MKNISKPARDSSRRINSPLADITLSTWVPILFLAFVFFLGGGSRSDIASLPFLRGAAVLFAFWAALQMRRDACRRHCIPLSLMLALHMWMAPPRLPLPPDLCHWLPGRRHNVLT